MHRVPRVVGVLIATVWPSALALAQPVPDVPAALAPWRNWVLYGEEFRACPVRNGTLPVFTSVGHSSALPGSGTQLSAYTVHVWSNFAPPAATSSVSVPGHVHK